MKICMIVPNPEVKGGIASVVNGYRESRLEKQHEIAYVESYRDGSRWQKLLKALSGYAYFFRQILGNRPDVVHIHSSFGPSFYRKIPFIYLSSFFKIPVVNHIHGAEFDGFYQNASQRKRRQVQKVYGKCNRLIVLSQEWKMLISQIVPAEKIDVLENYCILPDASALQNKKRGQILFLGELGERKGCFLLPEILKKVREKCPDCHLVMAGDGQITQVRAAFEAEELMSCVEFPGWVRTDEKDKLLQESNIFLFPTYHEGMPMAVLEAMSYGLGIVTTNVGGIPKLIIPGETGFMEVPGDVESMAADVVRLLKEEALCVALGRQAKKLAEEKYSLEGHLRQLEKIYEKVVWHEQSSVEGN